MILSDADAAALRQAYIIPPQVRILGPWQGHLDREALLTLSDGQGRPLVTLHYGASTRWPLAASSTGYTLHLNNPDEGADDPRQWRASKRRGGSPGSPEPAAHPPHLARDRNAGRGTHE